MSFEATLLILAWAAITILALAMAGLLRQLRILELTSGHPASPSPSGPGIGQRLPESLSNGRGGDNERFVAFMDSQCPGCEAVVPEVDRLVFSDGHDVSVLYRGAASSNSPMNAEVIEQMDSVFEQLKIPVTPYAVRVDREGVIVDAGPIGSKMILRAFVGASADNREEQMHG